MHRVKCPHCAHIFKFKKGGDKTFFLVMAHMIIEHAQISEKVLGVIV